MVFSEIDEREMSRLFLCRYGEMLLYCLIAHKRHVECIVAIWQFAQCEVAFHISNQSLYQLTCVGLTHAYCDQL